LKGFHLVIGSMAQMKAPAVLSIAGDGPERAWLRSLSEEVGGSDAVRFLGHVPRDEIVDLLKNSDVLAHPSLHDSGGWVCLEAMASGVPVVCLDWGGPGQQVTADCGIKVPVTTPAEVVAAIAAALDKLAASPELRAGMGEQGRRRVLEKYTWPVRVAALKEMYEEAVESASRSDRERST
jgi:glycosyltransferase involved in cell wall biosynthesis